MPNQKTRDKRRQQASYAEAVTSVSSVKITEVPAKKTTPAGKLPNSGVVTGPVDDKVVPVPKSTLSEGARPEPTPDKKQVARPGSENSAQSIQIIQPTDVTKGNQPGGKDENSNPKGDSSSDKKERKDKKEKGGKHHREFKQKEFSFGEVPGKRESALVVDEGLFDDWTAPVGHKALWASLPKVDKPKTMYVLARNSKPVVAKSEKAKLARGIAI